MAGGITVPIKKLKYLCSSYRNNCLEFSSVIKALKLHVIFFYAESRGIQSYLATAGTLFAGALGIIMTKIKILVILSVMTTVIGKLLLLYAFLKSEHFHQHSHHKAHHVPFVKYTKDKYYIKQTPPEHSHDVIVDSPHNSPYQGHSPSGVSYYKR